MSMFRGGEEMFNGVENDDRVVQPDPVLPLHKPGMKMCINVLAAGRPNYLYIALDSIFRNTVFNPESENVPDVFLYIDKLSSGESYASEVLKAASDFPLDGIFINKEHKGTVSNYWTSFDRAFADGYDFCILLEEDWLITTNALQWLYDVPKIATNYSVYRWTDRMDHDDLQYYDEFCLDEEFNGVKYTRLKHGMYVAWCLAFEAGGYKFIQDIIKANGHWGIYKRPVRDVPMPEIRRTSYIDWDRTIINILEFYGLLSIAPPESYLAHFGCKTSNYMGYGSGVNRHEQIFDGPKESWLDNVIQVFRETDHEEKTHLHLYPLRFEYR